MNKGIRCLKGIKPQVVELRILFISKIKSFNLFFLPILRCSANRVFIDCKRMLYSEIDAERISGVPRAYTY